jgi:hypothetical protein
LAELCWDNTPRMSELLAEAFHNCCDASAAAGVPGDVDEAAHLGDTERELINQHGTQLPVRAKANIEYQRRGQFGKDAFIPLMEYLSWFAKDENRLAILEKITRWIAAARNLASESEIIEEDESQS